MASSVVGIFAHQLFSDDPCALECRMRVHFVIQIQVQRTFERSFRAARTGADEQYLSTKLLDHLKRLLKFSLQRQDPYAALRDQAVRIDSRWHRSQFFIDNANDSFPSDRQLRFECTRAERLRRSFDSAIKNLIGSFEISCGHVVIAEIQEDRAVLWVKLSGLFQVRR